MEKAKCYGFVGFIALTIAGCSPGPTPPRTDLDDQPTRMVSAFFGLDNAIQAWRYEGADGMPILSSLRCLL
jgi:hypothetical protein